MHMNLTCSNGIWKSRKDSSKTLCSLTIELWSHNFFILLFLVYINKSRLFWLPSKEKEVQGGPTQKISEGEFQNETQYKLSIIKPWFRQIMCLTWWTRYFNPGLGVLFKYDFRVCPRLDRWPFAPSTFSCASYTCDVNQLWGNNC